MPEAVESKRLQRMDAQAAPGRKRRAIYADFAPRTPPLRISAISAIFALLISVIICKTKSARNMELRLLFSVE